MFLFSGYIDAFAVLVNRNHQPAVNFLYPYLCLNGIKKVSRLQCYFNGFSQKNLSGLTKYPVAKWELEQKKPPEIFWLLFPGNDLCLHYSWTIGLPNIVLSVFVIQIISNQNSHVSLK